MITTSVGAEGIDGAPWWAQADDPATFASAVVEALNDPLAAASAGRRSQAWARQRYGMDQFRRAISGHYLGRAVTTPQRPVR